jgi:hypothetical protein
MSQRTAFVILVIVIVLGQLGLSCPLVRSSSIEVFVDPSLNSVTVGEPFSAHIKIANVPDPGLYAFQLELHYDKDLLEVVNAEVPQGHFLTPLNPPAIFIVDPAINQSEGRILFLVSLIGGEPGKTGNGILASMRFRALEVGTCQLEIKDIVLLDVEGSQIPSDQYQAVSGSVDVAPASITQWVRISNHEVVIGKTVTVDIEVEDASIIAGGSFNLYFESLIASAAAVLPGDFGGPVFVINNASGVVTVAAVRAKAVGSDTAVLARITFRGDIKGSTLLRLQDVQLNDENGNVITPFTKNGSLTVEASTNEDVNQNGLIDTGDATLVLRMVVGLDRVDLSADINGNGEIDTGDATLILRKVVGLDG